MTLRYIAFVCPSLWIEVVLDGYYLGTGEDLIVTSRKCIVHAQGPNTVYSREIA